MKTNLTSRVFIFCISIALHTLPLSALAQTPPPDTGNTHTIPVAQQNLDEIRDSRNFYQFIAPIDPLIEGIVDITSLDGKSQWSDVTKDDALQQYLRAWFRFLIGIGGVIGVIRLVFAGFSVIAGSSKPGAYSKIREELTSIIISLVIVAGSWVYLNTINPKLVETNLLIDIATSSPAELAIAPEPTAPGWYFKFLFYESQQVRYAGPFKTNAGENDTWGKRGYVAIRAFTDFTVDIITMPTLGAFSMLDEKLKNAASKLVVTCPYERFYYEQDRPTSIIRKGVKDSVILLSQCEWFPKNDPRKNPDGTPYSELGSSGNNYSAKEDANRNVFQSKGIQINKNACPTANAQGCTTVGNLDAGRLLGHLLNLAHAGGFSEMCSNENSNCPIVITAGGEAGHMSHGGPTTIDIRKNIPYVERTLKEKALAIAPGLNAQSPRYYFDGFWYNDEIAKGVDAHFHVCKHQPPILPGEVPNPRLCGSIWSPGKEFQERPELICIKNPQNTDQWLCRSEKYNTVCPLDICKKVQWKLTGREKSGTVIETKLLKDIIAENK